MPSIPQIQNQTNINQSVQLPQSPILINTNQLPITPTPLYPIITSPTPYQFNYAQSSQQGTLNLNYFVQPQPQTQSQTQSQSQSQSQFQSITSTQASRGCEMMNNTNNRCIICKGGFYLGTKGICGIADPLCMRYNP